MRRTRLRLRLPVLGAALVAGLALAEGVLQMRPVQTRIASLYVRLYNIAELRFVRLTGDPDLPFVLAGSAEHRFYWGETFRTNRFGYFGDELLEPDPAAFLVVGDSVSFGFGLREELAFPACFRRAVPGARVGVIAAPGYSTRNELEALRRAVRDHGFRPRFVVLQFGLNDTLAPSLVVPREGSVDFYQRSDTFTPVRPGALYAALLDRSNLFLLLNHGASRVLRHVTPLHRYPAREAELFRTLGELRSLAGETGFQVILLNLPYLAREPWVFPIDGERLGHQFPLTLDLRRDLLRHPALWLDALHPSARGHQLIAERLRELVASRGLLEPAAGGGGAITP